MAEEFPTQSPRPKVFLVRILKFCYPFITIGVVWELMVRIGILQYKSLPAPSALIAAFWRLAFIDGILWTHISSSFLRLATGYLLAVVIGTAIGAILSQKAILHALFEPMLNLLMSIPTIAWVPIFLITLGLSDKTVITTVFVSSLFAIIYNTMRGIEMVEKNIVNAARTLGLNGRQLFIHVLLPASLLTIINGLRLAMGYAWRALVGGELLAAMIKSGLGKMVFQARYFNDAAVMLVGLLVIGTLGFLLDQFFITVLERNTVEKWGMTGKK